MYDKHCKYSIGVEREVLRCTYEGKLSKLPHPKIFGDETKNHFISTTGLEAQIKISTPMCKDVRECYSKLDEITNVVLYEIHGANEMLWAYSTPCINCNKDYVSKVIFNFKFNDMFFENMRLVDKNVPNTLVEAYKKVKEGLIKKYWVISKLFGEITVENSNDNEIKINLDVNPFDKCGISKIELDFLVAFLFKCLIDSNSENEDLQKEFDALLKINDEFGLMCRTSILKVIEDNKNSETIGPKKFSQNEILELSKKHMEIGYNCRYSLKDHPKLVPEAVVLIKDAITQGIDYNVVNEETSFVEFTINSHKELVIAGNKTDRDSYIFPIITDDKYFAKRVLTENGLNTPYGVLISKDMDREEKEELISEFYNKPVAIKPRNTNYGIGITVFPEAATEEQIKNATDYAFQFDADVILEECVYGMEYRFLVIGGKCLSVCHRRAASVVGDGKSTIKELIDEKNKEPWHALTLTPVKTDQPVEEFLKLQGYSYDYVPEKDKRVFLRKNSNCSTGGESVDMTYIMPDRFKKIAETASKAFNSAKICGIDIIIKDLNKDDYGIIEVNDNPGYSINEWVYEGVGERIGLDVLRLLGMIK